VRKLASIQRIKRKFPIAGADSIEGVMVEGWELVTKKNEFNENDKCVYIEIDSVVPNIPEFEFLAVRQFKVKTIKLRGQLSQGLAVPLSVLPKEYQNKDVGFDVTNILGVKRIVKASEKVKEVNVIYPKSKIGKLFSLGYLKNKFKYAFCHLFGIMNSKKWPGLFDKTDETRVQYMQNKIDERKDLEATITEKLDGCSLSILIPKEGNIRIFSRNFELLGWDSPTPLIEKIGRFLRFVPNNNENHYAIIARKYKESFLRIQKYYKKEVVIQGEILGPGIQKNRYGFKEFNFFAFNAFINDGSNNQRSLIEFMSYFDLPVVPFIDKIVINNQTVAEFVKMSIGRSKLNNNTIREGLVVTIKETDELKYLSFKVINPEFSLKFQDEEESEENVE
jgi:hypothetical protein